MKKLVTLALGLMLMGVVAAPVFANQHETVGLGAWIQGAMDLTIVNSGVDLGQVIELSTPGLRGTNQVALTYNIKTNQASKWYLYWFANNLKKDGVDKWMPVGTLRYEWAYDLYPGDEKAMPIPGTVPTAQTMIYEAGTGEYPLGEAGSTYGIKLWLEGVPVDQEAGSYSTIVDMYLSPSII